jgi:hypothetical protein
MRHRHTGSLSGSRSPWVRPRAAWREGTAAAGCKLLTLFALLRFSVRFWNISDQLNGIATPGISTLREELLRSSFFPDAGSMVGVSKQPLIRVNPASILVLTNLFI